MTKPDRLTIEQVLEYADKGWMASWLANVNSNGLGERLAQQLADTMRENEWLWQEVRKIFAIGPRPPSDGQDDGKSINDIKKERDLWRSRYKQAIDPLFQERIIQSGPQIIVVPDEETRRRLLAEHPYKHTAQEDK